MATIQQQQQAKVETEDDEPKISSKRTRRMQMRLNGDLQFYKSQMKNYLMTTRFNNMTWTENQMYRSRIGIERGCIYGTPEANTIQISEDAIIFVLEMNNETNSIIGIGMIRNHAIIRKHHIYSNDNYNRYAYLGRSRIDRSEMTEMEEKIMKAFDILCFTGPRHMKRLQGLKMFPIDILYKCRKVLDLMEFIRQMFKSRITTTTMAIQK